MSFARSIKLLQLACVFLAATYTVYLTNAISLISLHLGFESTFAIGPPKGPRLEPNGTSASAAPDETRAEAPGRFPRYGTPKFARRCNWTTPASPPVPGGEGCALLVRPNPASSEGLSAWTTHVVGGFMLSVQTGCRLMMDYGPQIDIRQVLTRPEGSPFNWSVPEGFVCDGRRRCHQVTEPSMFSSMFSKRADAGLGIGTGSPRSIVPALNYRMLHGRKSLPFDAQVSPRFRAVFPGFELGSGMACSLGSVFELAPSAKRFTPDLFSRLLPALRNKDNFVVALYVRTWRADRIVRREMEGKKAGEDVMEQLGENATELNGMPRLAADCALKLEGEYLSPGGRRSAAAAPSAVIWMVVSDSPNAKRLLVEKYGGGMVSNSTPGLRREVLSTPSRGVHTRPSRDPTLADFAEGFVDWYLLGESDVVVEGGGKSFGSTGALRTARPLFGAGGNAKWGVPACTRRELPAA